MAVNPSERLFFEKLVFEVQINPPKPLSLQTIAEFRAGASIFTEYTGKPEEVHYEDQWVPARDGHQIPIRIYNNKLTGITPVIVMFPGCGYILDLFEVNGVACSRIAKYSGIKVILVNFRLAPEYPLPQATYDAYDATEYIATHADKFKIDADRIFIGGISSGAHCAAMVSQLARQNKNLKIYHQILLNGIYDFTQSQHEYDDYEKEDKMCTREVTAFILKTLGISPKDYNNPLFSPYHEKSMTNLPATTLIVGEYDGLRNDSEAYFKKLRAMDSRVQKIVLAGQTHNTLVMRKIFVDGEDPANTIAKVIKQSLD